MEKNGGIQHQVGHNQDEEVDQHAEGGGDDGYGGVMYGDNYGDGDAIADDDDGIGFDNYQETGSNMGSELEKDARSFFGGVFFCQRTLYYNVQTHHRCHCRPSENLIFMSMIMMITLLSIVIMIL